MVLSFSFLSFFLGPIVDNNEEEEEEEE